MLSNFKLHKSVRFKSPNSITHRSFTARLLIIFLLFPLAGFAQYSLKGKVMGADGSIPYANVLLTDQEGKIESGSTTNEEGHFELEAPAGTYQLKIIYLGYRIHEDSVALDENVILPPIHLLEEAGQLNEVIVYSEKPTIINKVDRLVFNLEKNVTITGGNAMDVLKVSPKVLVGNEGQLSMIGKSDMRVMVDGRIIPLTGQELSDFLTSIPADDIKEVEIITNPPAKYEAQGNSGLVNIVYKDGKKDSWNNTTVLSYTQARLSAYSLSNNFNYQKNKLSMLVSISSDLGDRHIIHEGETFYLGGPWRFTIDQNVKQENLTGNFMLDYDLGERSTIGVQYLGSVNNPDIKDKTITKIYNPAHAVDSLLINHRKNNRGITYHSANAHYNTAFDTLGRSMSIDLDYFNYHSKEFIDVLTENYLPDKTFLRESFSDLTGLDQSLENYSIRVDFEHPFNSLKVSYGASVSFINNFYDIDNFNTATDPYEYNPLRSDKFTYSENKQALYLNASKQLGEKWETMAGLRVENTQAKGISNRLNETNKFDYVELFPTFYLSYDFNDSNAFSFNYGRRINRPSFGQLNPARDYINSNTYSVGNPFLQPSFTDNLELTHTFKGELISQVFLSYESDGFGSVYSANNETNEQAVIKANYFNRYDYGFAQFYTFDEISWWESQNSLYLLNSNSTIFNPEIIAEIKNSMRYYLSTNNTFILNKAKTIRSQVNFWYSSAYQNNIYDYGEGSSLDLALQYSFMKKRFQWSIGVYDVFNSSTISKATTVNNIKQIHNVYPSNRYFKSSLVYKFGSSDISVKRRKFGNEEDQNRAN